MGLTTTVDLGSVAHSLALPLVQVESVVRLLDAGNTVPFITRYRKDQTGGLDEEQIRHIEGRVSRLRMLAERKQTILRSIEGQGKLTPELAAAINGADSTKRLEDLYLPFKPKKQSLATLARQRQFEPLAHELLTADPAAADLDARAARFRQSRSASAHLRRCAAGRRPYSGGGFQRAGRVARSAAQDPQAHWQAGLREDGNCRQARKGISRLFRIPESSWAKFRRIEFWPSTAAKRPRCCGCGSMPTPSEMARVSDELLVPPEHPHADFLRGCVRDALARLVVPSLEREIRRELTELAETHAVEVFAKNLRNLLLQPPVRESPGAGRRSGFQERLQAGRAR